MGRVYEFVPKEEIIVREEIVKEDKISEDNLVINGPDGAEYELDTVMITMIINKRVNGRTVAKLPGKAEFIGMNWEAFSMRDAIKQVVAQHNTSNNGQGV